MKKIFLKSTLAVAILTASYLGALKAYDAYSKDLPQGELMLVENVLALSENHSDLKHIAKHTVYKTVKKFVQNVYDANDKKKLVSRIYKYETITGWWQTCDRTSDPDYKTKCYNDVCITEACSKAEGWSTKYPSIEGIVEEPVN